MKSGLDLDWQNREGSFFNLKFLEVFFVVVVENFTNENYLPPPSSLPVFLANSLIIDFFFFSYYGDTYMT